MQEIPVYLFLGFLESGKTTFLEGTLEDPRFNSGEKTLVLMCEEGEVELEPQKFAGKNVYIEPIEKIERLNPDKLYALCKKHNAERVIIEFNGMWPINDLYNALPEGWVITQCLAFFDGTTAEIYNANMRQLVVEKISNCDLVVFNRLPKNTDTINLHKLVRAISRRTDIAYEFTDGSTVYDDIEDPLPFDKNADIIEIDDRDYALWYRDISENMSDYDGMRVSFVGVVAADGKLPKGAFFLGRHVMTCCEADISYHGLLCVASQPVSLKTYDWIRVTGKIKIEKSRFYTGRGPVIYVDSITPAEQPDPQVATFY